MVFSSIYLVIPSSIVSTPASTPPLAQALLPQSVPQPASPHPVPLGLLAQQVREFDFHIIFIHSFALLLGLYSASYNPTCEKDPTTR